MNNSNPSFAPAATPLNVDGSAAHSAPHRLDAVATAQPTEDARLQASVQQIAYFFHHMSPADLDRLHLVYTADAYFKDPFNEVNGLAAIRGIFQHMYDSLVQPRFVVREQVWQGQQGFITWDFVFSLKPQNAGSDITVRGTSHLKLQPSEDGAWRIAFHRDYWDVAEELYEKLPLLGGLMRWLKKRVNAPA